MEAFYIGRKPPWRTSLWAHHDYTNTMVWELDVRTSGHTPVSQIQSLEKFILLFIILYPLGRFRLEKNRGYEPQVMQLWVMGYAVINLCNRYMVYADFIIPAGLPSMLKQICLNNHINSEQALKECSLHQPKIMTFSFIKLALFKNLNICLYQELKKYFHAVEQRLLNQVFLILFCNLTIKKNTKALSSFMKYTIVQISSKIIY